MTSTAAPYTAANWNTTLNAMYPNGTWYPTVQGWYHDSWFSDEARYLFTFNGPFSLDFYGDDDMYIFINGILVIDLGGVHQRLPGEVKFDATGMASIIEGGSSTRPGRRSSPARRRPWIPTRCCRSTRWPTPTATVTATARP